MYDGRSAGIIKAGLATDPVDVGHYWDEGLLAFQPMVTIEDLAASALTYDVVNQYGANPVWVNIELETGDPETRTDNACYQFVPATNPSSWHTVDAGAATTWQAFDQFGSGNASGPFLSLADIAALHPGAQVIRTYLRLGMGDSYGPGPNGTVGWVDKATIGGVTYDFVALTRTASLNWPHFKRESDDLKWPHPAPRPPTLLC